MFVIDSKQNVLQKATWGKFRGGDFLIAPTSNLAFQRAVNRLQAPHRKKIEKGTLDPQTSLDISCEAMGEHLVLGWKNVAMADGKEVTFSPDEAKKLLIAMPDFREFVQDYALDLENFRQAETEELGKS